MFTKEKKSYYIDVLLAVFVLSCMLSGIILAVHIRIPGLKSVHEWTGYISAVLIIVHFYMHWSWMRAMTKKLTHE
jgi:hypothetical protein